MALDLWFREDVARILASTQATLRYSSAALSPLDPDRATAYQQGFADALRAISLAFGISPSSNFPEPAGRQLSPTWDAQIFEMDPPSWHARREPSNGPTWE